MLNHSAREQPRPCGCDRAPVALAAGQEEAWRRLLELADERERRILQARLVATGPRVTLRALGEEFGVTRERVRQLECQVRHEIERRLAEDPACSPVVHLAVRLRSTLGALAPEDAVRVALADAVPRRKDADLRRAALLALAGPYRPHGALWERGRTLAALKAALFDRADQALTKRELTAMLRRAGVASERREACIAPLPLRRFEGHVLLWSGSAGKKAARVLRARPADEPR